MDNTTALADVITGLIEVPEKKMTKHGLADEAGIPWVTFRNRLIKPGAIRIDELDRIAAVLGTKPSKLLELAEERMTFTADEIGGVS